MAESWKGPTAVIGILTVLTTIGIFVYQEWRSQSKSSEQISSEKENTTVDTDLKPSIITYSQYEDTVGRWENKLESIEKRIALYDDSFKTKSKWIKKTENLISSKKELLEQPELPEDQRKTQQSELDSLKKVLAFENADTFRYQDRKVGLAKLKIKIADSLKRFKEFYKIE